MENSQKQQTMIPTQAQLTAAIIAVRNSLKWSGLIPKVINAGNCENFAMEVEEQLELLGCDGSLWEWIPDAAHCAFTLNGLWFDAECPEGADLADLPFIKRLKA